MVLRFLNVFLTIPVSLMLICIKGCFYFIRATRVPKYQGRKQKISIFNGCPACLDGPRLCSPTSPQGARRLAPSSIAPTHPRPHLSPEIRLSPPGARSGCSPEKKYSYRYGESSLTRKTNVGEFKEIGFDRPVSPLRLKISSKIRKKSWRMENVNPDFTAQ